MSREGHLVGLEHEFVVRDAADAAQVDFRRLIHRLPIEGRRLDPGDDNAYRLRSGAVITADGNEAEVAVPPVQQTPGFGRRVVAAAEQAGAELRAVLPADVDLEGFSTHISVSTPEGRTAAAAREFASRFGVGQMLLMDRADSPGLLIRPRLGRLELAAEYVAGDHLRAAAVFAAGATRAVARRGLRKRLPPRVAADVTRAKQRDGWYLDRKAFGPDLLTEKRLTSLRRERGGSISAQEHLEASWDVAREALGADAAQDDVVAVDRLVVGEALLPVEGAPVNGARHESPGRIAEQDLIQTRIRPNFVAAIELATWAFAVFRVWNGVRRAYASVPRRSLPAFLTLLEAGELDRSIGEFLADRPRARVLRDWRQAATAPGLFDGLGPHEAFVTPEIDVFGRPLAAGPGAGRAAKLGDRPGKSRPTTTLIIPPDEQREPRQPVAWLLPVAAALAVIGVVLVAGFVLGFFGGATPPVAVGSPTPARPTATTVTPGVAITPTPTPSPSPSPSPTPTASPSPSPAPTEAPVFVRFQELLDYIGSELGGATIGTPEERSAALLADPLNDFFKWDGGPVDVATPIDIAAGAVIAADSFLPKHIESLYALCVETPSGPPPPGSFNKLCGDGRPAGGASGTGPMYIIWIDFAVPVTGPGNISLIVDSDGDPANNAQVNDQFPFAVTQAGDQLIQLFPDGQGGAKLQMSDFTRPGQLFETNAMLYFGTQSAAFVVFGYDQTMVKFMPAVEVFEGIGDFQDDIIGPAPVVGEFPPALPPTILSTVLPI